MAEILAILFGHLNSFSDFQPKSRVINWSWIEEIIFWDTCLYPFEEVKNEVLFLPNLKRIKFRRSNSNEESDQEPILLIEANHDKLPTGNIGPCCPLVVAVQISRLISSATYAIDNLQVIRNFLIIFGT